MAATRAEIAAMLHRFIEKYELVQGKAPGGLMGWIDSKRLQIPKTGDSSVLGLWGVSLCTSLAGCLALTTWQIRRRREETDSYTMLRIFHVVPLTLRGCHAQEYHHVPCKGSCQHPES